MKPRISTLFPFIIFYLYSFGLFAQTPCTTCHDGAHWSMVNGDTNQSHSSKHPSKVTPNGNDILGSTPSFQFTNVCGLNYITESVETTTRESSNPGTGFPATFTLPPCLGAPIAAYIFWGVSYWEASPPSYTVSITNPTPTTVNYPANNIGTGPSKCWGEVGTAAYESTITSSFGAGGTYSVNIMGPSTSSDDKEIDGFTVVYIYNSGAAYSGSIALWDGDYISASGSPLTETFSGINVCAATANASGFTACGDEQANVAATHTDIINGTTGTFNNDFWNTDIIPVSLTAAQSTVTMEPYSSNSGDCYSWILAGLYWQNTSCVVCTPTALTVTTTFVDPTCGNNNGSATANVTGGTSPYTYLWSPGGQTTATATGLSAGTYTVTVKDATGCTTVTATVTLVTTQLTLTTTQVNAGCAALGSATVNVVGGTSPYTYNWTPTGGTNATATGLSAGSYTITVKDKNGCTGTAAVVITSSGGLTVTTTNTNDNCNGGNNATATATASGGTSPYTYAWTPSGGTNSTATGLSVGTYTITIKDANGCTGTASVIISQPPVLTATISATTNVLCNGGTTGSSTVTAGGGTPAYTYAWTPIGGTNATGTGFSAGTYTITITDANGCIATASVSISQPPLLTATITATTNVLCNGGTTGSSTVAAGGGTPAYTYAWTPNGGTNATGTGLSAGTYTITVKDANGCTATTSVIITQPPLLTATISASTNILCNGGTTGSSTVSAGGGTSPYTYAWTLTGGTNSTATGLSAGTYTITVKDANGCSATASTIITQPTAITATTSTTPATCGNSNGSASVTAGGGTPVYTYSWSPGGNTTSNYTGLSAGTYTITITDANGCTQTATAVVTQPSTLAASITSSTNILCNGGTNGSATVSATGGITPYTYIWSPTGGTNATATGLSAGTYTITVSDSTGCMISNIITLTQPPLLTATISATTNVLCNGGSTGISSVTAGGGTSPYTYAWTPNGGTNALATGLSAGSYTISITDSNGCTAKDSITITQPTALTATTTSVNINCNGSNTGSAAVTTTGGTSPYIYSWSPGGGNSTIISGLSAGTYTITITDANGCTVSATAAITEPPLLTVSTTNTNVSCFGGNNGSVTAIPTGGTSPYTYSWSPVAGTNATLSNLSAGTYTITVIGSGNCSASASVVISQPASPLSVTASGPSTACPGGPAKLSSTATGGTPGYIYSWAPGGASTDTATVYPASSTTYTIYLTDANGCTASSSITVNTTPPLIITVTGNTTACPGQPINLYVQASGGTGNYSYLWLPSNTSSQYASFTLYNDTTLTIEVTDACGITSKTITIVPAPVPTVLFNSNPDIGCYPLCIQFRDLSSISSGTIAAFDWNFGNGDTSDAQNPIYCYKDTGTFTVTLTATSSNGCSSTLRILHMIKVYPHPIANFIYTPNPVNILSPTVQFTDESTGLYPIYLWYWKFGDGSGISFEQNPTHTYSDTGTYCANLTVTDIHGCADSITECLDVEPLYTFYIPNAFTPNGDGINDIFQPKGSYIRSYEMYIFDRWGAELYHTTDFYTGWNGEVNNTGQPCQEDTYVYLIYVYDSEGTKHTYTGKVNLIR